MRSRCSGTMFGINAWIGLTAGIALAAVAAGLIGWFCVRTGGVTFLMLTLAFSQLVFSVALKWRDVTGGSDGLAIAEKPSFFGFDLSNSLVMYFMALIFFVLVFWGLRRLINAPLGHVFVGIRENEQRMMAIGYPTSAYKLLSFTIAGAIAGLAGGLYAIFNGFISADALYWTASGDVLIMTMLGGAGTLIGPAIGAGVFLLMKNVVSSYSEHWLAIIGITFICCVMFFPGGIWGAMRDIRMKRAPAMSALRIDHLNRSFGSLVVTDDVSLDHSAGRAARHHRPERRRQDQPGQSDRRAARTELRAHLCRRPGHHRPLARPDQPDGRGAHVPAQQPVPEPLGDRKPAACP